jgi:hypothetical protein
MADGAWWRYEHSTWTEEVNVVGAPEEGEGAFRASDSPNPRDSLRSDSIMIQRDGRWVRATKEVYLDEAGAEQVLDSSVDYGVGFTRFNDAWVTGGVGFSETPEYVRIETPAGGTPGPAEDRRHTFVVLEVDVPVTTPAGTFDCIAVQRTKDWQTDDANDSDAQTKIFWFAPGVGKVREFNEDSNSREVLVEFFVPPAVE